MMRSTTLLTLAVVLCLSLANAAEAKGRRAERKQSGGSSGSATYWVATPSPSAESLQNQQTVADLNRKIGTLEQKIADLESLNQKLTAEARALRLQVGETQREIRISDETAVKSGKENQKLLSRIDRLVKAIEASE